MVWNLHWSHAVLYYIFCHLTLPLKHNNIFFSYCGVVFLLLLSSFFKLNWRNLDLMPCSQYDNMTWMNRTPCNMIRIVSQESCQYEHSWMGNSGKFTSLEYSQHCSFVHNELVTVHCRQLSVFMVDCIGLNRGILRHNQSSWWPRAGNV